MYDVGRDEEAIGVGMGDEIGAAACIVRGGQAFADAGEGTGEEVATGTLAEERADFFVIEEADDFEGAGGGGRRGGEEGFNCRVGAELVVDTTGEDEFFFETAELGGLGVEEFKLPIYDATV